MLTDEIRRGMNSSVDFDFSTHLMLDLILQEAVAGVVQHLAICHASGTLHDVSQLEDTEASGPACLDTVSGFETYNIISFESDSAATVEPSFLSQYPEMERNESQQLHNQPSPYLQTLGDTLADELGMNRILDLGDVEPRKAGEVPSRWDMAGLV